LDYFVAPSAISCDINPVGCPGEAFDKHFRLEFGVLSTALANVSAMISPSVERTSAADIDDRMFTLLRSDGRQSFRELGDQLGVSAKQAGARLRRLLDSGEVSIIATVDSIAAGFQFMLAIAVEVDGPVNAVADALAAIPNVLVVLRMAGQYDIEIVVAAESQAELARLVKTQLGCIGGIRALHPSFVLDIAKFETGFGRSDAGAPALSWPSGCGLDPVDKAIIERLWENARAPNEAIGAALGLSESTVRARIAQMRRRNLIHVTAIRNIELGHDLLFAFIGVGLRHSGRAEVIDGLVAMPQTAFVASTCARISKRPRVLAADAAALTEMLDVIAAMPGVRQAGCAQGLAMVKYDARFALLTSSIGAAA
jgi:Lrp/AsnC family leucine-responsive transcriptional regulator